ncbi:hypothetical protein ASPWEDRAFT_216634 [Aspergillus wentii DTO 134E9]|uniref:Protein phosphatase 4 core regulatory subunit R2 n=1 Tax=Aspergillus wentii DTO 134E9 TaxID=1073089 RepID=A0A1L9RZX0_ASPWE|nr:uncharacterized protein ASPWEDRAFT_216634 [Aspergillus wentii DTO 134E9]OJJ40472.1 hypothetical protein ASPWEDRAFT_216634 [Aspergillus wentii DTO 134E9]
MSLDEESLETAANGGLMDFEKWAGMVEPLLERLEYIVYNAFPMPKATPEETSSFVPTQPSSFPSSSQPQDSHTVPSSSNKENASPADLQTPPRPTASSATAPSSSSERVPDSQPQSFAGPTNEILPAPLQLLLDSIRSTLKTFFTSKPPHTIQRFAELILRPNAHYRTLPAYLRALDRVISVTSSAEVFPLQTQTSSNQPNGILNGGSSSFMLPDHSLGSDESLGGALLTPIPWLSNATIDVDDGVPLDEDNEPMPIVPQEQEQQTQEPQAQEEDTAGFATQQTPANTESTIAVENEALGANVTSPPADTEEVPHARGPPVVGVEDMGLQDGKGVEMALSSEEGAASNDATAAQEGQQTNQSAQGNDYSNPNADGDGDILLGDVKGGTEDSHAESSSATDKPQGSETATDKQGA